MIWITYTTFSAEFQIAAWFKHDYVIKTLFIAIFIPFVFNSRKKIDACITTIVAAISFYTIVGCLRTILGGIQYGEELIQVPSGYAPYAETSTLAMVSVLVLPFIIHLYRHSSLTGAGSRPFHLILIFIAICSLVTPIGTQARTGLVALGVGVGIYMLQAGMKARIYGILVCVILASSPLVTDRWLDRMGTLTEVESEGSALGRIIVWKWTLDYVSERPIKGGGFMSYQANAGVLREYNPADVNVTYHDDTGKAFHSIYFEVLGEHGYVGLVIYIMILLSTLNICRKVGKLYERGTWEGSLARALRDALLIFMVCGNFVGVAFTHWPYYILGIAVCLEFVAKSRHDKNNVTVAQTT